MIVEKPGGLGEGDPFDESQPLSTSRDTTKKSDRGSAVRVLIIASPRYGLMPNKFEKNRTAITERTLGSPDECIRFVLPALHLFVSWASFKFRKAVNKQDA